MSGHIALRRSIKLLICISFAILLHGCNESVNSNSKAVKMNDGTLEITETTRQALMKIKNHRILFAHHSVGGNILTGLKNIAKESGVDFKVDRISTTPLTSRNKFVDLIPGKNTQPKTKIDGFVDKLGNLGSEYVPDIAFMKFCYVDFLKETDVDDVFTHYKKNIIMLKNKRPDIKFVHFSVPLMKRSDDIKAKMMRLVGRDHWIDITNVKRAKFNQLLFKTFSNVPIFDIAKIESTHPDGHREEFLFNGKTYNSMVPEYTDDGGHLNELGQRIVAKEFIHFLADSLK